MVEWKKLGEIADTGIITLGRGKIISKNDMRDCPGDFPVYSSSSQGDGEIGRYGKYMFDDERITWSIDGGGKLFYRNNLKYSVTNVCGWLKVNNSNSLNTRFLYYLLYNQWSNIVFDYNHKAHPSVIKNEYLIPILPLSEQERIVGILDTFTDSIENLKQQIAQRRKQYEHYRDQLLELEGKEGVEMKTLEDCAILISDGDHQPPPKTQQGIPFITISNINKDNHKIDFSNTYYVPKEYYESIKNERKAKEGDVLYTVTGSYGIPVNIDFAKEFCFQRHIAMIRPNIDVLLSKFLYHSLLTMGVKKQADENASGGAQKTVSLSSLRKFIIFVPPTSEQQRIVSILDTFEASITNLEAQLAQRQKQYEYYRNKLLTFE